MINEKLYFVFFLKQSVLLSVHIPHVRNSLVLFGYIQGRMYSRRRVAGY